MTYYDRRDPLGPHYARRQKATEEMANYDPLVHEEEPTWTLGQRLRLAVFGAVWLAVVLAVLAWAWEYVR